MSGKKLVPKRRFKDFQNNVAWEQRKYGEVIDLLSGQDFSPSEYNDTCNGIPYMTGASCIVGNETIVNRWTTVPRCLAEKGDVLLVCKGSGYGAIAVLAQDKAHIARQFMALKTLPILDKVFNFYLLNSVIENIKKDARGLIAGIARDAVIKQEISIPSLEEQIQIGNFFKRLDNLITLHQRKLEKTKSLKSAYLAEMFPAEGERVPKRRFTGFIKDWQETLLGNIGNTFSGMSGKTKKDFGHGDAEFVTYMNVFKNEISDILLTEKVVLDNKQTEVKYGDVLFTTSSETPHEVGMSSIWLDNRPHVYLNSFCFGFRPTLDINKLYLAYLLRSNEVRNQIEILAQGISRYNISKGKVMEITIYIPDYEEQQAIGEFFKKLDDSITNQQQKLNKLRLMKQAYLEEMFV